MLRPSPNLLLYYFGLGGPLTRFKLRFISIHQYYVITKFRVDRSLTVHSPMPQGTLLYPAYICHETPARRDRPRIHFHAPISVAEAADGMPLEHVHTNIQPEFTHCLICHNIIIFTHQYVWLKLQMAYPRSVYLLIYRQNCISCQT